MQVWAAGSYEITPGEHIWGAYPGQSDSRPLQKPSEPAEFLWIAPGGEPVDVIATWKGSTVRVSFAVPAGPPVKFPMPAMFDARSDDAFGLIATNEHIWIPESIRNGRKE